jgi:hypothetical protein
MFAARKAGARLRAAALLAVGALAVHELRYALTLGVHGEAGSPGGAHAYLQLLAPLLVAAAFALIAVSVLAPALHRRLPRIADPNAGTERAAAYALWLLGLFICQELVEALLSGAPAEALHALAGPGGWLALPLAMLFGALAELAGRWLDRAEARIASIFAGSRPRPRDRQRRPAAPALVPLCSRPLAFGLSRRPPPLAAA